MFLWIMNQAKAVAEEAAPVSSKLRAQFHFSDDPI